jgi:hypothetical protein
MQMRLTLSVLAALLSLVLTATAQVYSPSASEGGRIAGHVVTSYARLVAYATVMLGRINDDGLRVQTWYTGTDHTGAFLFKHLPPGRYRLAASGWGYTSRFADRGTFASPPRFDTGPEVDLGPHAHADLNVVLRPATAISGRVILSDGRGVSDVQVVVAHRTEDGVTLLPETITSSEYDGYYRIEGLPPGEFLVAALPRNAPPDLDWTWYPDVADPEFATSVVLLEEMEAKQVDISLEPAPEFSPFFRPRAGR